MINELYTDIILDAAANIPPAARLEDAHASATKSSRVCGSTLTIDIKAEDGVVSDFAMDAKACALGQAAASMVAQQLIGTQLGVLPELRDQMRAMLKDGAPPPSLEGWSDLRALESIRDFPQRHASVMLVFEALAECAAVLMQQGGARGDGPTGERNNAD